MAIDTEDKRRSVVRIPPVADGVILGVDKQHVSGFYRGIAAASPIVSVTPSCRIISILLEDRTVTIPYEDRTVIITCQ